MTGLYVHAPFCRKKCHYCDFVVTLLGSGGKNGSFFDAFEAEIAFYSPLISERVFETLYVGGGTPSTFTIPETEKFFGLLKRNFRFRPSAEISWEANPGDVGSEKAALYRHLGVTRVSLGAQSFNNNVLERANRAHYADDIEKSYQALREAGFQNINMDLMLSLPGQTLEDVKRSARELIRLNPEHVSVYELTVEDKTVFGEQLKSGALHLPGESEQVEMLIFLRDFLKQNGYRHYELLNYAKPGFESRHNLLYWANEEYLGLGPGAFSYLLGRRYRNSRSFDEYIRKAMVRDWQASDEEHLSEEKKEHESFLLALRLLDGVCVRRHSSVAIALRDEIDNLIEKGLLEQAGSRLFLSPKGQLFAETVFSELSTSKLKVNK
jgi:oxygen-independent coproporphyrinogen-3 oxidase